jgi:hypothetical protein
VVFNSNKNIWKNTVAIDGAPKKIIITDATGCNPKKMGDFRLVLSD